MAMLAFTHECVMPRALGKSRDAACNHIGVSGTYLVSLHHLVQRLQKCRGPVTPGHARLVPGSSTCSITCSLAARMSRPAGYTLADGKQASIVAGQSSAAATPTSDSCGTEELLEGLMQRSHKRNAVDAGLSGQNVTKHAHSRSLGHEALDFGSNLNPADAAMAILSEDGAALGRHADGQGDEEGEVQAAEGEQEEELVVTETVAGAAQDMAVQLQSIEDKIQALMRAGVAHLDSIKENFVNKMNRYIQELHAVCDLRHERWCGVAHETIHGVKRLDMAKQLVSGLGLATDGHPDMEEEELEQA